MRARPLLTIFLAGLRRSHRTLPPLQVVRRVHALACGQGAEGSVASEPRPHAVVSQHAAQVLGVIDHVADGEPPEAQLDYFCALAERIRAGDGSAASPAVESTEGSATPRDEAEGDAASESEVRNFD